jgi:hypothetical protein
MIDMAEAFERIRAVEDGAGEIRVSYHQGNAEVRGRDASWTEPFESISVTIKEGGYRSGGIRITKHNGSSFDARTMSYGMDFRSPSCRRAVEAVWAEIDRQGSRR